LVQGLDFGGWDSVFEWIAQDGWAWAWKVFCILCERSENEEAVLYEFGLFCGVFPLYMAERLMNECGVLC
jgi:hypothetical protein